MQKLIAERMKRLRMSLGMTQSELAKALETSQSAVTRMEAGAQNFSLEMIERIGNALGQDLVEIPDGTVNFRINGGKKLSGSIDTKVSKNAAVVLLCASLLNSGTTTLKKIPKIEEVHRIIEVLRSIGVKITWTEDALVIKPPKTLKLDQINRESAKKTRSIIMFLGPLMHIMHEFNIPFAGGCKLGDRSVRPHLYALEPFGLTAVDAKEAYQVSVKPKKPGEVILFEAGDTVTENALMAAAKTDGETTISFASANYMVQELCFFLKKLGVKVSGIGTSTMTVTGVKRIHKDVTYYPSEDPIESMLFLSIAAVTKSEITITRCPIEFLQIELMHMERMGFEYTKSPEYKAANGQTRLVDITTKPSKLVALNSKITALPYPGLNIDNLPFFVPIAAAASGRSLIHDWVYENRAIYYTDLTKLGAKVDLADPHRVYVTGKTDWHAAEVLSPPALRPSAIILIGMLAAPGTSLLRNVYSINRGYEDLAARLRTIGADIESTS